MKEKELDKMSVTEMGEYLKELNDVYNKLSEFEKLEESGRLKKINSILSKNGVPKRYLIKKVFKEDFNFHDEIVNIREFLTDDSYVKDVLSDEVIIILKFADKLSSGLSDNLEIVSMEEESSYNMDDDGYSLRLNSKKFDRVYNVHIDFNNNYDFKINYGFIKYIEIEFEPIPNTNDFHNSYAIHNGDDELIFNLHSNDGNYATTDDIEKIAKGINEGIKEFKDNMINIIKNI